MTHSSSSSSLHKLGELMTRSGPCIEAAIGAIGADHRVARSLAAFLDEIQSLHQQAHRELLHACAQSSSTSPSSSSSTAEGSPFAPPAPAPVVKQSRSSKASSSSASAANNNNRTCGKMLRFNRKEMDFVRQLKTSKASIQLISASLTRDFPKWAHVDPERLLAKIRRVRKRKDEEEEEGEEAPPPVALVQGGVQLLQMDDDEDEQDEHTPSFFIKPDHHHYTDDDDDDEERDEDGRRHPFALLSSAVKRVRLSDDVDGIAITSTSTSALL